MTFALAEHLVFSPVEGDRAATVARRIRLAMALGVLSEGHPLPSETELAARLGVPTTTLRAALAELRDEGWIETRRGRGGGSFLRSASLAPELWSLAELEPEEIRDLGDQQIAVAGAIAALAAERAHGPVIDRLDRHAAGVGEAQGYMERVRSDCRFHIEVAAATRSTHLAGSELTAQSEITPLVWAYAKTEGARRRAAAEHRAIVSAIRARDPETARVLAESHTSAGIDYLIQLRLDAELAAAGIDLSATVPVDEAKECLTAAVASEAGTWASALEVLAGAVAADFEGDARSVAEMSGTEGAAMQLLGEPRLGLFAAGFVALPQAFDGRGGEVWLRRSLYDDKIHPTVTTFFQTGDASWWLRAVGGDGVCTIGPYVDASGSDQYVVTTSRRVRAGGHVVGVVAVDVTVRQLQRRLHRYMAPLPAASCVVDEEGAVLVTGTGRLLGRRLGRPDGFVRAERIEPTGWRVVVGPQAVGGQPRNARSGPLEG